MIAALLALAMQAASPPGFPPVLQRAAGLRSAAGEDPTGQSYELTWIIAPHAIAEGDRWIEEDGEVVETRLLPIGLYQTQAPVASAEGRALMGAGQELIRLRAARLIACNFRPGLQGTQAWWRRVCLVDSDGDGDFDAYFERGGTDSADWLTINGTLDDTRLRPVGPAEVREIRPEQMDNPPVFTIRYQAFYERDNLISFDMRFRERRVAGHWGNLVVNTFCDPYRGTSMCVRGVFPARFTLAGLVVELLERRGEEVRMRVAAPFERREVIVSATQLVITNRPARP